MQMKKQAGELPGFPQPWIRRRPEALALSSLSSQAVLENRVLRGILIEASSPFVMTRTVRAGLPASLLALALSGRLGRPLSGFLVACLHGREDQGLQWRGCVCPSGRTHLVSGT